MKVTWNRSDEGHAESKCGSYRIAPIFLGHTRPVAYSLTFRGTKVTGWCSTQAEAKRDAEKHARNWQGA